MFRKIKIGDLGIVVTGKTPRTDIPDNYGGDIPFLTPTDLNGEKCVLRTAQRVSKKGALEVKKNILPPLTICFSCIGTIGNVVLTNCETIANQQFNSIILNKSFDPDYIYYVLRLYGKKLRDKIGNNSTVLSIISKSNFVDILISIEDNKDKQIKIGRVLSKIDERISLNKRMNAELEAMAKQLYDYWFVQFDFPDENGKPYKSSGGKMVYNEKLKREIPEGWGAKPVSNFIEHINTGLNPRQNFVLGNGNIKYITVKNLRTDGTIDFSNCDLIDEDARAKVHKRSAIQIKDILFASIAPLGRCHIIMRDPEDWDINESVFSIRPKQELISPYYLYIYFMSDWFVKKAEKETAGSIFAGIRVNSLMEMPLLYAPHRIFELFEEKVDSIFKKRELLSIENNNLVHLRDSLLPMLMNGQVTVE